MRERLREYELMFIISPLKSGEEEINAAIQRVAQTITDLGGSVQDMNHASPWGRRKFAYALREYTEGEASRRVFTEGYYVLATFKLSTSKITELERVLKLSDYILRYLLTLVEKRRVRAVQPAEDTVAEGA